MCPQGRGAWRVLIQPVISCRTHGLVCSSELRDTATSQARLVSSHQGWVLPCESSLPEEPVTSAQHWSLCFSSKGTASGCLTVSGSAAMLSCHVPTTVFSSC